MTIRTVFPTATGSIEIGDGLPTHLIAEIGLNHNGSEELARDMIRQAAIAGATFVKFQKRSPADLATADFLDAPFEKCPAMGRTQREVRERLELPLSTYKRLREYAESLGLVFFASAFDLPSLDFLLHAGVQIIKIASHCFTHGPLLQRIAELNLPVIASIGGTTIEEREKSLDILHDNPLVLLHCVSSYPTPDTMATLDTIAHMRERYGVPVGFSSHEVGIDLSVASSLLGACMIERHFTLNRAMIGLDQPISLEPPEFAEMALKVRRLKAARGIAQGLHEAEKAAKYAYHVAVCSSELIPAGTVIKPEMLVCKQPLADPKCFFTGLELDVVVGQVAKIDLAADSAIPRDAVEKKP
ncbi:N-acetylneuraminate synthase family protein [Desulfuromonas acetexigens]|uniref:N-acylneuraminate-9-phosphate synthase n=1 Tax=Trichloromonas acetexigens TaxID=38815 RepID=A0A550JGQ8_9BACT|nr:N-acetylneuraminate synthase family protein [Desulfuromonas acetexigens]TRO82371.1 N-acylneuraminate-9-phosphate synthase [Desulfuromonas acetexigens]